MKSLTCAKNKKRSQIERERGREGGNEFEKKEKQMDHNGRQNNVKYFQGTTYKFVSSILFF